MASKNGTKNLSSELKIQHAHDRLFRESMQDIDIARKLSFSALPSKVKNRIDWETLEIVKESWVDENLREHRSDVIYRAKILGNDQWVYLLFEHKSTPDKKIHFQLLRYIVEIWDQHEKQNGVSGLFPLIIPIVICHCNGRPCNMNNSMKDNIAILEGIDSIIPDFHFLMLDLSLFNLEQIEDGPPSDAGTGKLKMLLLALKYSRSPEILSALPQIIRISKDVEGERYDFLYVILTCLHSVIKGKLKRQFGEIVEREHKNGEAIMYTIADSYRDEGRREKERELKELRKAIKQKDTELKHKDIELKQERAEIRQDRELMHQIVKRMAQKRISLQLIQEITGLKKEAIKKIIKSI